MLAGLGKKDLFQAAAAAVLIICITYALAVSFFLI